MKTIYHKSGTVTYWSVYLQTWIRWASRVPDRELAAMSSVDRERVQRHLVMANRGNIVVEGE